MSIPTQHYVGIDVSKEQLDVFSLFDNTASHYANTQAGISQLVEQMKTLAQGVVIVEATGGFEMTLVQSLATARIVGTILALESCSCVALVCLLPGDFLPL